MTSLMGIDVNRIIAFTFLLGSLLAGAGGVLWAMKYPQVNPFMGIMPGLKAFIAAVLGGIGNVSGAVLGGLLLGMLEIMIVALFPSWSGYRDAVAFVLLIILLLARPTGLLGEALGEEKL
jgi:branched-chain amino acid transport system permease protein